MNKPVKVRPSFKLEAPNSSTVGVIREVFQYLERYKGETFVLRIDDRLLDAPLFPVLVRDIVFLQKVGIHIVIVPGAKHSIDKVLKAFTVASASKNNIRITSDQAMPYVKLGASNVSNAILSCLSENGAQGVIGNWVRARAMGVIRGVDYQYTGRLEKIDVAMIKKMMAESLIPVVPNIGWNVIGKSYNLSSTELAVGIAANLKAKKLFFITPRPGIPANPPIEGADVRATGVYSNLDLQQAKELLDEQGAQMAFSLKEIVRQSITACSEGVDRVHVIDGSKDGILLQEIFSSSGIGTMFYANEHANIRQAKQQDIAEVLRLMQPYVDAGVLVQRNSDQLAENIERFYVYQVDGTLHGCGALRTFPNKVAELEALVVDKNFAGRGTGRRLVSFLVQRAKSLGMKRVVILTTQTSDFFMRNGFVEAPVTALPKDRQESYNTKRNSRVYSFRIKP